MRSVNPTNVKSLLRCSVEKNYLKYDLILKVNSTRTNLSSTYLNLEK